MVHRSALPCRSRASQSVVSSHALLPAYALSSPSILPSPAPSGSVLVASVGMGSSLFESLYREKTGGACYPGLPGRPNVSSPSSIPVLRTFRFVSGRRDHMVKQLNGFVQRRSLMRTRWLLQACLVLAVGVGLVSCTQAQIDQAMNRPAEILQSSRPCEPTGVASTAVPEFCVNLTEIQVSSHDTKVDVSLTLVNRGDRRLFLLLTSWPYLTDSSGTKWGGQRNTGTCQ